MKQAFPLFVISMSFLHAVLLVGCATGPNARSSIVQDDQYDELIDHNTQSEKVYDGFTNTMDLSATMLTARVLTAEADHQARIYQWSADQLQSEKTKTMTDLDNSSQIFLSFFVPDHKQDDLQATTTNWKIFLDVNGHRLEPKEVKRLKAQYVPLHSMYPHHTRWHTAYVLTFSAPMTQLQTQSAKLTITGPSGNGVLQFKPAVAE